MLIERSGLKICYGEIQKNAKSQACTVLIFVSPECDSLCALYILTTLLKSDNVKFKVHSISGYNDLQERNKELLLGKATDIRSIIMINCGGTVNCRNFLQLQEGVAVYIVDSHRPYALENVRRANEAICILEDVDHEGKEGKTVYDDYPPDFELSDEEDDDEEDEIELDEVTGEPVPKKPRTRTIEETARRLEERETKRRRRKQIRDEIARKQQEYYAYSYYGSCASNVFYDLATELGQESNDLLWMRIVGFTEHLIFERMNMDQYKMLVANTNERVVTFNTIEFEEKRETKERLEKDELVSKPRQGEIQHATEYRFMLLRHWSLYDSMYHSPYVASRLSTWTETGSQQLKKQLTKWGLPLAECKIPFSSMGIAFKTLLRTEVAKPPRQNDKLPDIVYPSFTRQHGSNFRISASDMVYAIQALLEQPFDEKVGWEANIFTAFAALRCRNIRLLQEGLERTIDIQRAVVRQGIAIIKREKKKTDRIIHTGDFRFGEVPEGPDSETFSHPINLLKLAYFIQAAFQQSRKIQKPLVLCCCREKSTSYLVVGVMSNVTVSPLTGRVGPATGGIKNWFGKKFREAADKCNARINHDAFDTAIMEVRRDDLKNFLEVLHYSNIVI